VNSCAQSAEGDEPAGDEAGIGESRQDQRFLKALRIAVDEEA
jgi:hypothetical protein